MCGHLARQCRREDLHYVFQSSTGSEGAVCHEHERRDLNRRGKVDSEWVGDWKG